MVTYHHFAVYLRTLYFQIFFAVIDALNYFKNPETTSEVEMNLTEDLDELIKEVDEARVRKYDPLIGSNVFINTPFMCVGNMLIFIGELGFAAIEKNVLKYDIGVPKTTTVEEFLYTEDRCFQDTGHVLFLLKRSLTFLSEKIKAIDVSEPNGDLNKKAVELALARINPLIREVLQTYVGGND